MYIQGKGEIEDPIYTWFVCTESWRRLAGIKIG
jgi:hypothetical protein